jgi:hypothetical protein
MREVGHEKGKSVTQSGNAQAESGLEAVVAV